MENTTIEYQLEYKNNKKEKQTEEFTCVGAVARPQTHEEQ